MNFFQKIIVLLSAKRYNKNLKKYSDFLDEELKVFKKIEFDKKITELAEKLSFLKKYRETTVKIAGQRKRVETHNYKIQSLEKKFDKIMRENDYNYILANILDYPLDILKKYNETALLITDYSLPNDFSKKGDYALYMLKLGDIIENYQDIIAQYSLIKQFKGLTYDFDDEYIDFDKKTVLLKPARELIAKISNYSDKYYSVPVLDENIIKIHNEKFIKNHLSDSIFNNINGKSLDENQRRAILCSPLSNLVIAGAGAGKTLTICGKVKYLLETQQCLPQDILLLSYSSASASDLSKKTQEISNDLKVKTFHALGLEILNHRYEKKLTVEDQFQKYVKQYFENELPKNPSMMNLIINYFGLYLYKPDDDKKYHDDGEKFEDFKKKKIKTLKDKLRSLKNNSYETIQNEYVKSYEELIIANFLFINGIRYEYERTYKIDTSTPEKRQYTPDFYLPDYDIYIEHYGVDKNFRTPQYDKNNEDRYLEGIRWKRFTHKVNNTICIETYSYEFSENTVFENLTAHLTAHGVKFNPLSDEEINNSVKSIIDGRDFSSFLTLVTTFLSLYKSQYTDNKPFDILAQQDFEFQYFAERTKVFINICKEVYNYYINSLREQGKIDFDDMILQATEALDNINDYHYKYVIVDEFQDISQSRVKFLQKLIKHGDSKLFAVGDDWQAIYRFSGCDINIFLHFEKYFKDVEKNYIISTHRNSQELQNIVEPFITANPEQFFKHIRSDIHQDFPVRIIYHNDNRLGAFNKALKEIAKIKIDSHVLVLGRNRHDVDALISDDIQVEKYEKIYHADFPMMSISYKTVHQSKGLEEDFVILISGEDALNGFPNQMEDDIVLDLVLSDKSDYLYAEERRLFYVALTRTRSIVYLLSDRQNQSIFIEEIKERVKIENPDMIKENIGEKYLCPWCKSGKLVLRESPDKHSFYGCTNYPYCKYTINDLKAVRTNLKCPFCGDFLTIRNGKNGKFVGCHNFPRCRYTRPLRNDDHFI